LILDLAWEKHLAHRWEPEEIRRVLSEIPGLKLQEGADRQHRFKISYEVKGNDPSLPRQKIQKLLRENNIRAKVLLSQGRWLDVIPLRSGKGQAIRYVAMRWGIPAHRVLIYARRGSDYEALSGQFLAVLGSDHSLELQTSGSLPRVYQSGLPNFEGLYDGIEAYGFDRGTIRIPEGASSLQPEDAEIKESVLAPDMVAHMSDDE
jgi:sucrose-phosphate synthase